MAPAASAILAISALGPVMRDVPESTMPLVGPEEKEPTWTLPMSICQYLGSESGTQDISPVYLSLSVGKDRERNGKREDDDSGVGVRYAVDDD